MQFGGNIPSTTVPAKAAARWLNALTWGVIAEYAVFFIVSFHRAGPRDGDQFLVFHTLQFWNATMFGMAKQWTPLLCAGLSMAGEPQVPFMSMSMALSYLFGPLIGVKSAVIAYLLLGWLGAYLYAGLWLQIRQQRFLAAALYIGNGFFFCRLGFGHFDFVPFLSLPLLLWTLHRATAWHQDGESGLLRLTVAVLLMGGLMALAIDGSPVAIIHLMLWVGLYVLTLAVTLRSWTPAAVFACAAGMAATLDAGYLWPMLQAQAAFPRLTPDRFTSFLSLIYFLILPIRGKLLPANGNGHELSVFIGPLVAYCIFRQRHWLAAHLPPVMKRPLLVVSIVSIVLGMGSLKVLHIPTLLSPFDLLRPLPGFRSIGVTGRYWGFLALPLSLMGAVALCRFAAVTTRGWQTHLFFACVLLFQLGFQGETLSKQWLHSPDFKTVEPGEYFRHGAENIEYVGLSDKAMQGELMTPNRGVSNCYDMDDFVRTGNGPGKNLVLAAWRNGVPLNGTLSVQARFATWSNISITAGCDSASGTASCRSLPQDRIRLEFRQAFHRGWHADNCTTSSGPQGNLVLDCPASHLTDTTKLIFHDPTSETAAHLSMAAWAIWLLSLSALIHVTLAVRMMAGRRRIQPRFA